MLVVVYLLIAIACRCYWEVHRRRWKMWRGRRGGAYYLKVFESMLQVYWLLLIFMCVFIIVVAMQPISIAVEIVLRHVWDSSGVREASPSASSGFVWSSGLHFLCRQWRILRRCRRWMWWGQCCCHWRSQVFNSKLQSIVAVVYLHVCVFIFASCGASEFDHCEICTGSNHVWCKNKRGKSFCVIWMYPEC